MNTKQINDVTKIDKNRNTEYQRSHKFPARQHSSYFEKKAKKILPIK